MAGAEKPLNFAELLRQSSNPSGLAALLFLIWIMQSDGESSREEQEFVLGAFDGIKRTLGDVDPNRLLSYLARISRGDGIEELALAGAALKRTLDESGKRTLLELLISLTLVDKRVSLAERYVLECIADILSIDPVSLNEIYRSVSGRDFSVLGDPSSKGWWDGLEQRRARPSDGFGGRSNDTPFSPDPLRISALTTLGLEVGASTEEIKTAFRRLSMVHHPDRYQQFGPEAAQIAHKRFLKIKEAYEYLAKA